MELYNVIGIEMVNYISKKTDRKVSGGKLHLTYDFPKDADADGTACEVVFVKEDIACSVEVGDTIELLYNKFGSVVGINKKNTEG